MTNLFLFYYKGNIFKITCLYTCVINKHVCNWPWVKVLPPQHVIIISTAASKHITHTRIHVKGNIHNYSDLSVIIVFKYLLITEWCVMSLSVSVNTCHYHYVHSHRFNRRIFASNEDESIILLWSAVQLDLIHFINPAPCRPVITCGIHPESRMIDPWLSRMIDPWLTHDFSVLTCHILWAEICICDSQLGINLYTDILWLFKWWIL